MKQLQYVAYAVLAATLGGACTMKDNEAPDFAGPSEFGKSITLTVTPDIITQDGVSQSVVTVTARGPNSEVLANVPLRAEILVNGTRTDFGALSARNVVTAGDGKATFTYTAPAGVAGVAVDDFTVVDIGVTPIGSDFGNSIMRTASVRLVPRGSVAGAANLRPAFTPSTTSAGEGQNILFDASSSTSAANNPIADYLWDFGDGGSGRGITVSHAFTRASTYAVTLTIADALGRTAQTSRSVTIAAGAAPVANFVSSPAAPARNTAVTFNASGSTPATGRSIASYVWDFGDPANTAAGSGVQATHTYTQPGTYTITLVVTDDLGRKATRSATVTVS